MKPVILPALLLAGLAAAPAAAGTLPDVTTTSPASAPVTAPADRWADRPWLLNLHLSVAGPAGSAAAELERNLQPWMSVAVGAGSTNSDAQLAGMLRLRKAIDGFAVGLGGGLSTGAYEEWLAIFGQPDRREDVVWANGELFVEARSTAGLSLRVYGGASHMIDEGECVTEDCDELAAALPYVGTAFGAAF